MARRSAWLPAVVALSLLLSACSAITGQDSSSGGSSDCADYPTKPVTILVHTGPGGGSDLIAREIAQIVKKHEISPQPFVVENAEGGDGASAIRRLASGDDHTTISTPISVLVNIMRGGIGVNLDEVTPIARMTLDPNVWLVRDDAPWKNVGDLLTDAERRPGKITVGFGTIGSSDHLLFYQVARDAGAKFSYVNHDSGGAAMVNMLGGHVDMASGQPSEALEQIRAGKARGLVAFSTERRLSTLPTVPTAKEAGIDVTGESPRILLGAPEMCEEAVTFLESAMRKVAGTPEWKQYVKESGALAAYQDHTQLDAYLDDEVAPRLSELIEDMDLKRR
ncbi:MAG: hypothetical protein GEV10_17910 [Streptosporangiales bacterium]|nr:hypothetical protein [Streptosporangiales bacterium]